MQRDGPAEKRLVHDEGQHERERTTRGQPEDARGDPDKGRLRENEPTHLGARRAHRAEDADLPFAFGDERRQRQKDPSAATMIAIVRST